MRRFLVLLDQLERQLMAADEVVTIAAYRAREEDLQVALREVPDILRLVTAAYATAMALRAASEEVRS